MQVENEGDSFTLRIIFSGLCAFIPDQEVIVDPDARYSFDVALVNAREEKKLDLFVKGVRPEGLCVHYPFLVFSSRDVEGDRGGNVDPLGVWKFDSEELSIEVDREEVDREEKVKLFNAGAYGKEEPDPNVPGQEKDFCWLPRIHDALPGGRVIDSLETLKNDQHIVGLVKLRTGTLSSHTLGTASRSGDRVNYIVSQFVPPRAGNVVRQAMASEVMLEIEGLVGNVGLTLRSFNDGKVTRELLLRPGSGSGCVTIFVVNVCSPDVLNYIAGDIKRPPEQPVIDNDFKWFYLLVKDGIGSIWPPVPYPVKYAMGNDEGGGEAAICTGCVTNPASGT